MCAFNIFPPFNIFLMSAVFPVRPTNFVKSWHLRLI